MHSSSLDSIKENKRRFVERIRHSQLMEKVIAIEFRFQTQRNTVQLQNITTTDAKSEKDYIYEKDTYLWRNPSHRHLITKVNDGKM